LERRKKQFEKKKKERQDKELSKVAQDREEELMDSQGNKAQISPKTLVYCLS